MRTIPNSELWVDCGRPCSMKTVALSNLDFSSLLVGLKADDKRGMIDEQDLQLIEDNLYLSDNSSDEDDNVVNHDIHSGSMYHHGPYALHQAPSSSSAPERLTAEIIAGKKRRRTLRVDNGRKKRFQDTSNSSEGVVFTSEPVRTLGSKIFTPEKDKLLREAVAQHGRHWDRVMAALNFEGVTRDQYQKRYAAYLDPDLGVRDKSPWTEDLEKRLVLLVRANTFPDKKGRDTTNWNKISKELNRQYFDCQNKWNTIRKGSMSVGRFTAEDDEQILRAHREWSGKGKGLWVSLEKTMNRRNDVIRKRFNLLAKRRGSEAAEPAATHSTN